MVTRLQSNLQEVRHIRAKQCVWNDAYYCYSLKSMLNDTHIEYVVKSIKFRMQPCSPPIYIDFISRAGKYGSF